jgi:N-acyl-D-aspartate/D-glutamate deacylase
MAHDLVIRGGALFDGTGAPPVTGDLAIDGGRLTQVGGRAGAAQREIDAAGLAVAPGFIDPHTHYDAQISWDPSLTPSCWNGITSCVMGNCGFTLAPCKPEDRTKLMRMLERVEGMSLAALEQGIRWTWQSFPEYLDALAAMRPALNVGGLIGHSALRYFVLGNAAGEREATPAEFEQMRGLLREALRAGALGFSTSQAPTHLDGDGKPVPSRAASDAEVVGLASVLGEFGRGAFEITAKQLTDVDVSIEVARRSGRPVTFLGAIKPKDIARVDAARESGLALMPQTSCRPSLMDFRLSEMGPFDTLPCWVRVAQAKGAAREAVFRDPEFRARFRHDTGPDNPGVRLFKGDYDGVKVLVAERPDLRKWIGKSVADAARERGADPLDAFFDLALEDGLRMQFSYCVASDLGREPSLLSEDYMIGLSDAGAHLTLLADHAYTTYFLGVWVRERKLMSLEQGIRKLTQVPARVFGIRERGELREGWHADVVIFDPTRVCARESELVYDLPGGGARLVTKADGIEATIVNGEVAVLRGELTGARSGQVIRGA